MSGDVQAGVQANDAGGQEVPCCDPTDECAEWCREVHRKRGLIVVAPAASPGVSPCTGEGR